MGQEGRDLEQGLRYRSTLVGLCTYPVAGRAADFQSDKGPRTGEAQKRCVRSFVRRREIWRQASKDDGLDTVEPRD